MTTTTSAFTVTQAEILEAAADLLETHGIHRGDFPAAALHALEHQQVPRRVLVDQVESKQRMPQMVEHAHKQNHIEALIERSDIPH